MKRTAQLFLIVSLVLSICTAKASMTASTATETLADQSSSTSSTELDKPWTRGSHDMCMGGECLVNRFERENRDLASSTVVSVPASIAPAVTSSLESKLSEKEAKTTSPYYPAKQLGYNGIPTRELKFEKGKKKPLLLKLSMSKSDEAPKTIYILGSSHNLPLSALTPQGIKTLEWLANTRKARLVTEHDVYNWFVDGPPPVGTAKSHPADDLWESIASKTEISTWMSSNSNMLLHKGVALPSEWDVKSINGLGPVERILALHYHAGLVTCPLYGGMDLDIEHKFKWYSLHRLENNDETVAQFYQEWQTEKDITVLKYLVKNILNKLQTLVDSSSSADNAKSVLAQEALGSYLPASMINPGMKLPPSVLKRNELWSKKIMADILSSVDDSHPPFIVCGYNHLSGGKAQSLVNMIVAEAKRKGYAITDLDMWSEFDKGTEPTWVSMADSFGIKFTLVL